MSSSWKLFANLTCKVLNKAYMTVPFWFKTLFKAIALVDNTSFNNFVIKSVYEVLVIQHSFICDYYLPESITHDELSLKNKGILVMTLICVRIQYKISKFRIVLLSFANVVHSLCFVTEISCMGQCIFRENLHLEGATFTFWKTYFINSLKEATPIQYYHSGLLKVKR